MTYLRQLNLNIICDSSYKYISGRHKSKIDISNPMKDYHVDIDTHFRWFCRDIGTNKCKNLAAGLSRARV